MRLKASFIGILLVSLCILGLNIHGISIYALDEAKNAECAREMFEQGEWIVPTFNYELRTDKPPLHYYAMILAFKAFGVNEFSARIFSVLMGGLCIALAWWFAHTYINRETGWWTAIVLWASLHFSIQFHMAVPDPYLIFAMTLSLLSFYGFFMDRRPLFWWGIYIGMSMGILAKGPVAIAIPGLIMFLFLISQRSLDWKTILAFRPLGGILLVLGICLPWYILVGMETDWEWTRSFFLVHNVGRFTATMEGHGGSFLLTFAYVGLGMLPFSVFLFQAIGTAYRERRIQPLLSFSLLGMLGFIGFFAISSTKLPNYTVPSYPFFAIVLAYFLADTQQRAERMGRGAHLTYAIYTLLMAGLLVGAYLGIQGEKSIADLTYLAAWFLVLPVGAIAAWGQAVQKRYAQSYYSMLASWLIAAFAFYYLVFPKIDKENAVMATLSLFEEETPVAYYKNANPAYSFYLQKPIKQLHSSDEVQPYLKAHPNALLIARKRTFHELDSVMTYQVLATKRDLFESPTTVVVKEME